MAEITGIVTSIIFRNDQNGYTVLEVQSGRDEFAAVGSMPFLSEGERVTLRGAWTEHPTFGPQLKVEDYESTPPSSLEDIERYLASGLIRGVGSSTARAIVETFGGDTLDILQMAPDRIAEVPGIGPKRAAQIAESFAEQSGMQRTMIFLRHYDISPAYALRIYKKYEGAAPDIIKQNPFRLVDDIPGIGFRTADRIAGQLGIARDSEFRLGSGIKHVLREAGASEGHMYLPIHELKGRACDLLNASDGLIDNVLGGMAIAREVLLREAEGEELVYLPGYLQAEEEVAMRLTLLCAAQRDALGVAGDIAKFEREQDIVFSEKQRAAVMLALDEGVVVITGGPGTGKTTIINCIITLIEASGKKAALCAPTGRAAKRMGEASGREAKTMHRLLEYAPGSEEERFMKNQDDPLDFGAVIVDEMSMVDVFLMRSLLRAVKAGARLVMVGDVDQLPSVGAGNVLRDVIDSGAVPVARLDEIFRQAAQSMIIRNAHRINRGEEPLLDERSGDFFFDRRDTLPMAAQAVIDLVTKRLPGYLGVASREIQVLCPMKKGEAGVHRLNAQLQAALNPPSQGKRERVAGEILMREGDKVMQTRNNYQLAWTRGAGRAYEEGLGVFNGDLGFVEAIDAKEHTITVLFDDERRVVYDDVTAGDLELSYAMSIHKSQGSEFPVVVIPIVSGPPMLLTRNLLYTAVTRARRMVVLVGARGAILRMTENNRIVTRHSRLAARLAALEAE